jgi:hypothetical protein
MYNNISNSFHEGKLLVYEQYYFQLVFHAGKFIVALILFLIIIFHAMLKILFLGKNKSKDIIIIKIIIILGVGGQKRW